MSIRLVVVPFVGLALMAIGGAHSTAPGPAAASAAGSPPARLVWPIHASWVMTQPYGCTPFPMEPVASWCPTGHFHAGIDMATSLGTPIYAAASGVARVADDRTGYGLYVVIDHGGGVATLYGHMDSAAVRGGEPVAAGQQIGRVGSSGLSTGPHLHFEVRRGGRPVDPSPWLPAAR